MKQTLKSTILKFLDIFNDLMHHFQPIQQIFINYQHMKDSKKVMENFQKILILFFSDPESLLLIKN